MVILILLSIGGIIAGLLLLRTVPTVPASETARKLCTSVIIPARNEAFNLPPLLTSLRRSSNTPAQTIVVDDASTDATASVADQYAATVLVSAPLQAGWTGKTWAAHQGAQMADCSSLFFLDADTYFLLNGYARITAHFASLPHSTALSILPFHRTKRWYEEFSLFFNILVAMGAGGFGKLDPPHLFGQSLLISRDIYDRAGSHASVKGQILENLHFATRVLAAGGNLYALGGRGSLEMRMFPNGFAQLHESWQKAFADGASTTNTLILALSVYWLSAAMLAAILAATTRAPAAIALYLINTAQIFWYARQLGTFRFLTALLYPIPLAFYFAVFAQSLSGQKRHRPVTWRGRQL